LVGPGGQDESYNCRIRDRAKEIDNVIDEGLVAPDEIHNYYRDAIALVNTSAYEGFPNTFLEAWQYNTPVLSLSVDPNRFIDPNIEACGEDNFETLVDLSKTIAENVDLRRSLGETAGDFVRTNLSIETVAKQYATSLENALNTS
jgi:glycosyltransferase involved in cell wall biosynthesis